MDWKLTQSKSQIIDSTSESSVKTTRLNTNNKLNKYRNKYDTLYNKYVNWQKKKKKKQTNAFLNY